MPLKNKNTLGRLDYGVMFGSAIVLLVLIPTYFFVLPQQLSKSNANVVHTKKLADDSVKNKKVTVQKMPDVYKQAQGVFKEIADAQTVLVKDKVSKSKLASNKQYTQKYEAVQNANKVLDKYTAGASNIGIWGTSGDWTITPEISTLNSGTKIGVSFDVSDKSGTLMYSKVGTYNLSNKTVSFDNTYETKAYKNSQEAGD